MTAAVAAVGASGAVVAVAFALHPGFRRPIRAVTTPPERPASELCARWLRPAAAGTAIVIGVVALGPALTAAGVVGVRAWRRSRPIRAARARRAEIERALPEALDLLVLSVRAGLTPRQAAETLVDAAPDCIAPAWAAVIHRTERGQSFADAVRALPEMLGPRAGVVADAIASCERSGLALEPLLEQLTTDARETRRRIDTADARTLPVRLSFPLVVCTLPAFVLLAIAPAVIAALSSLGSSAW